MPAGKQPGVFVFAGDLVGLSAEHDAVAVEQKNAPARTRTGDEVITQLGIQRLAQVGQPEYRHLADIQAEVIEDDLVARIDRRLPRADPEIRVLHIVRGDAGILADENHFAVPVLGGEFPRFQQDRVQRRAQPARVEKFSGVEIHRPVAALEDISLINADVAKHRYGFRLAVPDRAVGEDFEAIVAGDLDARAFVADSGVRVADDRTTTVVLDFQILRHCQRLGSHRAEGNRRRRHRRDRIHRRRNGGGLGEDLRLLGGERQERERQEGPCTGFQHRTDQKTSDR